MRMVCKGEPREEEGGGGWSGSKAEQVRESEGPRRKPRRAGDGGGRRAGAPAFEDQSDSVIKPWACASLENSKCAVQLQMRPPAPNPRLYSVQRACKWSAGSQAWEQARSSHLRQKKP
eukprot:99007-Hanusia_phi.AAC.4